VQGRICIHVRAAKRADALARALELVASAQQAVLTDRFRSQHCQDLPCGRATQLGAVEIDPDVKRPHLAASFQVQCHFEEEGS